MKNILILTNFSENSWNSIQYALELFKNATCNFYLLNTSNLHQNDIERYDTVNTGLLGVKSKVDSKKELEKLLLKIDKSPLKGSHSFSSLLFNKDIIDATRGVVNDEKIDLIVIGTNGLSSQGNMKISSLAEELITKVKCSILIVPKQARYKGLTAVAFPTDYTNYYEAKLLDCLTESIMFKHLKFVYLNKLNESLDAEQLWNKNTLEDYFKNLSHSFHSEINKNLDVAVEQFVAVNKIDLLILGAKNINFLEQILFRPKHKRIKYYKKTPFLVLHESNHQNNCKHS